jgi:hypothetical protein
VGSKMVLDDTHTRFAPRIKVRIPNRNPPDLFSTVPLSVSVVMMYFWTPA